MNQHDEAIFHEVEELAKKIIESNARRFANQLGMGLDEARQEARIGLMGAMRMYDYNAARGGIYNFMSKAVRRHFLKLWATARTQRRRPHVPGAYVLDKRGKRVALPAGFAEHTTTHAGDFMDTMAAPMQWATPDAGLEAADTDRTLTAFMEALEAGLAPRDLEVLRCKFEPPRGLKMLMLDELAPEPTIPLIGRYLKLSKNEVDWALRRIREKALELLLTKEFSEVGENSVLRSHGG